METNGGAGVNKQQSYSSNGTFENQKLKRKKETIMKFKLLILLTVGILCFNNEGGYSQTTNFYGTNKVQSDNHTGALFEVDIDRNKGFTYVKIVLVPTRFLKSLRIWTSYNTKIKAGDFEAQYFAALENTGTYYSIDCNKNIGFENAKYDQGYFYTLVFSGAIPPGLTDFSLIDEGSNSGCRGFSFRNYTLNNPDNHPKTNLSETLLKQKVDEENDGIVGIYEPFDKSGCKLGCIKDGQNYKLVYLGSGTQASWWKIGDVKAILRPSATNGVFKADWFMLDKTLNSDTYVTFDGTNMKTKVDESPESYLKMYPTNAGSNSFISGSQKSSGSGFAISSKGFIVTNYHVTNGAQSIKVRGINGDFSKLYTAKIEIEDKNNDLSIIKITDPAFTSLGVVPYTISNKSSDVGNSVFALGYPLKSVMGDEIKLTNGIISSKSGFQGDVTSYQISVPVQPGNSGGPLFDANGNLIGIVNAKLTIGENVSYAIKSSYLLNLIELIPNPLRLQSVNTLTGKTLASQVKVLNRFVYIIEIN